MLLWGCAMVLLGVVGAQNLPDNILNEPDWGFQSYLDADFEIPCNNSDLVVVTNNFIVWELPNGHMLDAGTDKYVLKNYNNVAQMHLQVKNVQESDAGVYLCHVYNDFTKTQKRGKLLRGLNLGGHKFREPFEEYRYNLMVGGLAALALFVPLVTICLVYKFRYQTDQDRHEKHQARKGAFVHQRNWEANKKDAEMSAVNGGGKGQDNPVYVNEMGEEVNTRL
ncbi:uncharacterized protein [Littorina saxatilis]|uniref:Ig-like domain-containing protein n=1 Tax=Littorina saxatilis TaxID=31220 RepID=A0AAN9B1D0_9CAEN